MIEEALLALLESLGCGGLILDEDGRVLQTNDRARRYLGADLRMRRFGQAAEGRGTHAQIQAALHKALRASSDLVPQLGRYMVVPRAGARPLLLRNLVFAGREQEQDGPRAAVVVLDMEDCPLPDEDLLRDVFLFSSAEVRLARRLACGEGLSEIAPALGVKVSTLRVQLKMLFLKTGTRRQGELVALLAHLSRLNSG